MKTLILKSKSIIILILIISILLILGLFNLSFADSKQIETQKNKVEAITINGHDTVYISVKDTITNEQSEGKFKFYLSLIMFISVIVGYVLRVILNTKKAIRHNSETPNKWSWSYFIKDNIMKKINSICAFIISIPFIEKFVNKLFESTFVQDYRILFWIIIGICGIGIGWFIDFIMSKLQSYSRKKC